jgi:drug/metabolite transporter (DMT)-like permease
LEFGQFGRADWLRRIAGRTARKGEGGEQSVGNTCNHVVLLQLFYNYGLAYATMTSSVVLSNTSPTRVFLLSISRMLLLKYSSRFNLTKFALVVFSLAGCNG